MEILFEDQRLVPILGKVKAGVRLDAESLGRLVIWMDLYAQRLGHFSDQQEKQLADLRRDLAPMLAE